MTREKWLGWAAAISSTVALSTVAPVASFAIRQGMNPTTLSTARFTLTVVLLAATYYGRGSNLVRIPRLGLLICLIAGLVNGVGSLAYFWSFSRINASIAAMIVSIYPVIVLGLLALRGEPDLTRRFALLAGGLAGVYLLLAPGGESDLWGALLAIVAAAGFAIHLVLIQWYLRDHPLISVTFYITAGLAAGMVIFWALQGAEWHVPGWPGYLSILWLAVIGTFFARLLAYRSIKVLGSGQLSLLSPLETLLAVIWALIFLQETLTPVQWLGGGLILASALLAIKFSSRS